MTRIKRSHLFNLIFISVFFCLLSCNDNKPAPQKLLVQKTATPFKDVILDSLNHPWSIAFINNNEAFITEKNGQLLKVNLETKSRKVIKGFPDDLIKPFHILVEDYPPRTYPLSLNNRTMLGNGGILDVVLHPDFSSNKKVIISYVSQKGNTFALKVIGAKIENDVLTEIKTLLNPGPYVPGLWHFGGGLCIKDNGQVGNGSFTQNLSQNRT